MKKGEESKTTKKMGRATHSSALLNLKDIESVKGKNLDAKSEAKVKTLDETLKNYNKTYEDAMNAPVPPINIPFNQVLVRAVPINVKTRSGLIISVSQNDFKTATELDRVSHAVTKYQEILMVGAFVTEAEQEAGIRPGMMAEINFDNYLKVKDNHQAGMLEKAYEIPVRTFNGYKYMLIDKRDIVITFEKGALEV